MRGHPVTIRTLDLGARQERSTARAALNPALGLRAIRYCLAEPQLFLAQLRAILRASHYGKAKILLPMLAHAQRNRAGADHDPQAKEQLGPGNAYDDPVRSAA